MGNGYLFLVMLVLGLAQLVVGMEPSQEELNNDLLHAASSFQLQVVRRLLTIGADVNTMDQDGNTPLMLVSYSTMYFSYEPIKAVFKELISAGARVKLKNNNGNSALILAARGCCIPKCKWIIDFQGQRNSATIKPALLLLNRMKQERNATACLLYRQFRALLLPHLDPEARVIPLDVLRGMRNNYGKRACDYLPIYQLIPSSELRTGFSKVLQLSKEMIYRYYFLLYLALIIWCINHKMEY